MNFIFFLIYLKLLIAIAIPILAPFLLQFKNESPKVKKSGNKSGVGNEADKKLTLEMEELESEKIDDDDGAESFSVDESEKEEIEEDSFELGEPIRNFVTFWKAPIVKFFYFQV